MSMVGYAVKRLDDGITIINHHADGTQSEACYYADDVPELIALLTIAHREWQAEMDADYAAECEALNRAEDEAILQRERALEMDFSAKGYDDIPF